PRARPRRPGARGARRRRARAPGASLCPLACDRSVEQGATQAVDAADLARPLARERLELSLAAAMARPADVDVAQVSAQGEVVEALPGELVAMNDGVRPDLGGLRAQPAERFDVSRQLAALFADGSREPLDAGGRRRLELRAPAREGGRE